MVRSLVGDLGINLASTLRVSPLVSSSITESSHLPSGLFVGGPTGVGDLLLGVAVDVVAALARRHAKGCEVVSI